MEDLIFTNENYWHTINNVSYIKIEKIYGLNGLDFSLRPSLHLTMRRKDGTTIYSRSVLSFLEKTQANSRVMEPEGLFFSISDGLIITVTDQHSEKPEFKIGMSYILLDFLPEDQKLMTTM